MRLRARASGWYGAPLKGVARAPSDKSISHRALILGALAQGTTEIEALLDADDVRHTADAVRAFGASVEQTDTGRWRVTGKGGFAAPAGTIDCGNSGTGARLLIGAAAGFPLEAKFDGDDSLRSRPMGRIADPLRQMGATLSADTLPLTLKGGGLTGITHRSSAASAQIKSAVLLAGLNADGETIVIEPAPSRDHTETMLTSFGAAIDTVEIEGAARPRVRRSVLRGSWVRVPSDPSSVAFAVAAALLTRGSEITLKDVMRNPLRTGFYDTIDEMRAPIVFECVRNSGGETVADIVVRSRPLLAASPPASRAPSMIDEYPILAVLAAFAEGETRLTGAEELRLKESDRIALMVRGLRACGVEAEELPDGLIVRGRGPNGVKGGAEIETHGDHRIAMAFLVLGTAAHNPVIVDRAEMIDTSFPDFAGFMRVLGADIAPV